MGFNPWKEAEKKANKAIDDVLKPAAKAVTKGCEDVIWKLRRETWDTLSKKAEESVDIAEKAKNEVESTSKKAVDDIDKQVVEKVEKALADQLPKHLEKVFLEQLPTLITKQGPKIVENVVDELGDDVTDVAIEIQQSFAKPGFQMARKMLHGMNTGMTKAEKEKPELISHVNEVGHSFRLGLIKLRYQRVFERIHLLTNLMDQYCDRPPKFCRSEIRDCLMALGPDVVEFTGSVSANIVVIGSKIMEYESEFDSISLELAVEIIDAVLEAAGVPE